MKKIVGIVFIVGVSIVPIGAMQQRDPFAPRSRTCGAIRLVLSSPYTYEGLIVGGLWCRYGDSSMLSWDNVYKLAFVSFASRMLLPQDITSWFVDVPIIRHIPGYRNAAGEDISDTGILHQSGALYATQVVLGSIPLVKDVAPNGELVRERA